MEFCSNKNIKHNHKSYDKDCKLMTLYEVNPHLDNSYNFNIISAW